MAKQSLEIRTHQWYEIVLEANSSSLSKKEWCRQNSIFLKRFYYRQRKLRQKEAEKLRDVTPAALACLNETSTHPLSANTPVDAGERIVLPEQGSSRNSSCRKVLTIFLSAK